MLTIFDRQPTRTCQGWTRREMLRIGALGWGGMTLGQLLSAQAQARPGESPVSGKSVVLLFLQGGPSQIETFDPKLTAPAEIRSVTGEVSTTLPGITFGGTFPQLAQIAHRISIVRSYASKNSGHTYQEVASGRNGLKATLGAIYTRVAGTNHPLTGMPLNTLVLPEAVAPEMKIGSNFETSALPTLTSPGDLGPTFAAFNPIGGGELQSNMEMKISRERFDDRRHLLDELDNVRRQFDRDAELQGVSKYRAQAFEIIARGIAKAFDLSQEDPATLARYDTTPLFDHREVQRWYDMKRASNCLGKQMLLARRLCEAGCGFVTVSDCGWDMHSNSNSPANLGGMYYLGPQVDQAVNAFVQDIEERGLSDRILLVVTGEMGRTPRLNKNGGRDHWGNLTPLLFAGGGLKMGQVIGQSDNQAGNPASEEYTPANLMATMMHALFDVGTLRLTRGVPREILQIVEQNEPIAGLL